MSEPVKIAIFGDSIMKATVMDDAGRYRACFNDVAKPLMEKLDIELDNRARFGFTVDRGRELIISAMEAGERPAYALVEYGGNDCNFDWRSVAASPECEHLPATPLPHFIELMDDCVKLLQKHGVKPVLMSLPPIDGELYYKYICAHGVDASALLNWLGDPITIYRYQEMYSLAVTKYALSCGLPFVDVRSRFLDRHDNPFGELICADGLHPSIKGYELVRACFEERLRQIL